MKNNLNYHHHCCNFNDTLDKLHFTLLGIKYANSLKSNYIYKILFYHGGVNTRDVFIEFYVQNSPLISFIMNE